MIAQDWLTSLADAINRRHALNFLLALFIFFVGRFIATRARVAAERLPQLDSQQRILIAKVSYYGLLAATFAAALSQLGIDVKLLVGAAGVFTVAVGFAAQTSTSNLISGLFLMIERPFSVGDVISIGDVRGEVMSVDLLSSKIRTFHNLMVRVPNETLVKSNLINHSYFPIRRLDFSLNIAYDSDLKSVEQVLRDIARAHPLCLEDPVPIFLFNGFSDGSLQIQLQVWTLSENMVNLQNDLYRDIKRRFDALGIRVPLASK